MNIKRLAAITLVAFGATSAHAATWLPIRDALQRAKESGKLVVLFLSDGRDKYDVWVDEWTRGDGAGIAEDVVLARGTSAAVVLREVVALRPYFSRSKRLAVLVTDPDGEPLFLSGSAFDDFHELTLEVKKLNEQRPAFLFAAQLRRKGQVTESMIAKGEGLLGAFMLKSAEVSFAAASDRARLDHDKRLEQIADIHCARTMLEENRPLPALSKLGSITAHPENDSIAAQAWYLTGAVRWMRNERKASGDAYARAYRLAQKPSPLAEAAQRHLEMLGIAVPVETSAEAGGVHLTIPKREVMAGRIQVAASAPGAARVEFLLDDARVTERTAAPFTASISLGTLPRIHTIKIVAYDARGARIGEDAATINDHASSLSVRIIQPRGETIERRAVVEVQPRVPDGVALRSIDLYWKEQKLVTMIAPPFRHELTLPSKNASGYLRAVARDSAGGVAEDAKLINAPGVNEDARIDAVELYAIVQDHDGRNVEGLTAADFEVKEDGKPVKVEMHSTPADPITVGIAVDTSGSMREAMMAVADYAAEFVQSSLAEQDETMLIAFDDQPHVIQPLTSELQHVRSDLSVLAASGETAVWDSIIYSVQQLQAAHGKRALLVFTDGHDNASRTDVNAAIQIARESGVPVYVVLMYSENARPVFDASGLAHLPVDTARNAIEDLVSATGGTLFRFPKRNDLPKLFAQVRDDTRGEYLLTFVSQSAKPATEMRRISVAVPSRRVVVRAKSGYYAR
ncbi:MAG: Ca-activated chloride channel [Thermoanaerobaculia bacterium]|jgi:VWFA-related protein|nr:Ca-activated chloride channel [Thermoanaerobaculia bacterium]